MGTSHLKNKEKETIRDFLQKHPTISYRRIGNYLGRHHTTIIREIELHGGRENYSPIFDNCEHEAKSLNERISILEMQLEILMNHILEGKNE